MITKSKFSPPAALLKRALVFYRRHLSLILTLLALPILLRVIWELLRFEGFTVSLVVTTVAIVSVNLLAQIAIIDLIIDDGARPVSAYLKAAGSLFWPFFVVTLLTGILSLAAFALLVVPGIIVAVWLIFASLIVVVEGKRGWSALVASREYVRGHWWLVFKHLLFLLALLAIALAGTYLLSRPFAGWPLAHEVLSTIVAGLVLSPIGTIYLFSFYQELKNEL